MTCKVVLTQKDTLVVLQVVLVACKVVLFVHRGNLVGHRVFLERDKVVPVAQMGNLAGTKLALWIVRQA